MFVLCCPGERVVVLPALSDRFSDFQMTKLMICFCCSNVVVYFFRYDAECLNININLECEETRFEMIEKQLA